MKFTCALYIRYSTLRIFHGSGIKTERGEGGGVGGEGLLIVIWDRTESFILKKSKIDTICYERNDQTTARNIQPL